MGAILLSLIKAVAVFVTLQQTAGQWGLTTPMPGETGAGHQPSGLRSSCQTCCAPFGTRGPTRVCQSASKTWLTFALSPTLLQPTFTNSTLSFTTLSDVVNHYPVSLWTIYTNEPGTVCEVGILSQHLSIYSGQWDVIHMRTSTQSFSGNNILSDLLSIFVVLIVIMV